MSVRYLDEAATYAAATVAECADALTEALRAGMPGEPDPARIFVGLPPGELLLMPSRVTGVPTVKLVTIHHDADRPDPRIKGVHVVFDPESLAPIVIMDAAALTVVRTTAISMVALRAIAAANASSLVIFGAGPQSAAHLDAIAAERPIDRAWIAARRPDRAQEMVAQARLRHPDIDLQVVSTDAAPVDQADIVVCATTATTPLFDGARARQDVAAVAIGVHSPTIRELPGDLVARSFVVVEERESALREAGDIAMPIAEGLMSAGDIAADLADIARAEVTVPTQGGRVFKSMGMAWEDAVVSARIAQ